VGAGCYRAATTHAPHLPLGAMTTAARSPAPPRRGIVGTCIAFDPHAATIDSAASVRSEASIARTITITIARIITIAVARIITIAVTITRGRRVHGSAAGGGAGGAAIRSAGRKPHTAQAPSVSLHAPVTRSASRHGPIAIGHRHVLRSGRARGQSCQQAECQRRPGAGPPHHWRSAAPCTEHVVGHC